MTPDQLEAVRAAQAMDKAVALVTDLSTHDKVLVPFDGVTEAPLPDALRSRVAEAIRDDRSALVEEDGERWFVQVFNPPLRLVIVGAVHIAQALAPMARLAGYAVTVVDPRRAFATEARFPGVTLVDEWPDDALEALGPDHRTAMVTLTHDPKLDDPALLVALRSPAFYVGALGSRRTHARRLERLREEGADERALARIHGPAGYPVGATTPSEIAVAVLAQMTAARHGRETRLEAA